MSQYDPEHDPDATAWLAMDEGHRIELVLEYHRRIRAVLPNERLHAAVHVIVEHQVGMGDELPVAQVLPRLRAEGLDRHDAIHAIASVLAAHLHDMLRHDAGDADRNQACWAELDTLTARRWRRARKRH